jgi:hypothetical protein
MSASTVHVKSDTRDWQPDNPALEPRLRDVEVHCEPHGGEERERRQPRQETQREARGARQLGGGGQVGPGRMERDAERLGGMLLVERFGGTVWWNGLMERFGANVLCTRHTMGKHIMCTRYAMCYYGQTYKKTPVTGPAT